MLYSEILNPKLILSANSINERVHRTLHPHFFFIKIKTPTTQLALQLLTALPVRNTKCKQVLGVKVDLTLLCCVSPRLSVVKDCLVSVGAKNKPYQTLT